MNKNIFLISSILLLVVILTGCIKINPTETTPINQSINCIDTDGGKVYTTYGEAKRDNQVLKDMCGNDKLLLEAYCENSMPSYEPYNCDCTNGVCVTGTTKKCSEPTTMSGFQIMGNWPGIVKSGMETAGTFVIYNGNAVDQFLQVTDVSLDFATVGMSRCSQVIANPTAAHIQLADNSGSYTPPYSNDYGILINTWYVKIYDTTKNPAVYSGQDRNVYVWCTADDRYLVITAQQTLMDKYFSSFCNG